jgi:ferredoxin
MIRINVIEGKCVGHARCAAVAPEVYVLDEDGYLDLPEKSVLPEIEGQARRGARACPERAINVIEG